MQAQVPNQVQALLHKKLVANMPKLEEWFLSKRNQIPVPIYSSYDIRDSGFKISNVDANIFPAGFNNICITDRENAGELAEYYIKKHYGDGCKKILLLTEEHTNNLYYWENVRALKKILDDAGLEVRVAIPRGQVDDCGIAMKTASGDEVKVCVAAIRDGEISVKGFEPDLVVSNNDFSEFYAEWGPELKNPMNPPRELGWYQRKKSNYFEFFNQLCTEVANVIDIDPWVLTVRTELFEHFDMTDQSSRERLAEIVNRVQLDTLAKYKQFNIDQKPFVFVKNNSGTYGLGVLRVQNPEEVLNITYKSRKKMKAAKGGRDVEEVIVQEGIPSIVRSEGVTAEPTIYLLGCRLAGGFLRSHSEKDETESLNSPGAVYKRLCVTDLRVDVEGHPLENVYGWVAKIGLLAIGLEAQKMNVQFKGYSGPVCSSIQK